LTTNEKEEKKKTPRITELVAIVSVMVTILIAGTSLLGNQTNVPWWWFNFSFIILIALTFFIPSVVFYGPISRRLKERKLERKQDEVAEKYFAEFKDLADSFGRVSDSLSSVLDRLRGQFEPKLKEKTGLLPIYLIQEHGRNDLTHPLYTLSKGFEESNKSFRELVLLLDEFDTIINIANRVLRIVSIFAREMKKDYSIPDNIESEYEDFRDKYNAFLRDFRKYCRKANQEIGETFFPEFAGEFAKKW